MLYQTAMMKFGLPILAFTLIAIALVDETIATHRTPTYCWINYNTQYVYCSYGCCDTDSLRYCCSDEDDDDDYSGIMIFAIVASSIGGLILLVSVIITIICIAKGNCCKKNFKGRVMRQHASTISPGVINNTYSQTTYLPQTRPTAPSYQVPAAPVYQESDLPPVYPGTVELAPPRYQRPRLAPLRNTEHGRHQY